MSIWLISLFLFCSITFIVTAEAKTLANCRDGRKLMAKTTKNPNEFLSSALESYNTESDQIISWKTFEEIIREINDRTIEKSDYLNEGNNKKYLFRGLPIHSLMEFTTCMLKSAVLKNLSETGREFIVKMSPDLLDIAIEKLQKVNIDLRNLSSSFHEKSKKLMKLYDSLHNASNDINEEMEFRFEKARDHIDRMETKFANEIKITNDLIAKTKFAYAYSKEGMWNIESLTELLPAYEDYLLRHGIKLSQNPVERHKNFMKKIL